MIAILGGGFGLYGYLPALVACGHAVALPETYRPTLLARPELAPLAGRVTWFPDEHAALAAADAVAIARRPADQEALLAQILSGSRIERLLLEKPLARTPAAAAAMQETLERSGRAWRIGYTFRFTPWARQLRQRLSRGGELSLCWTFRAHHFAHARATWKRRHADGGGAVRFYGIQVLALLAECGYRDVLVSDAYESARDEISAWRARFAGPSLPTCTVSIDSNAAVSRFAANGTARDTAEFDLSDPFAQAAAPALGADRRVAPISELALSLWNDAETFAPWYGAAVELWRRAEEAMTIRPASELA
jgi:predicted dehydrogenase